MTITTTVTERDKKLLCILGIFIIVIAFIMFLIKPAIDQSTDLKAEIATQQTIKNQIQYKIAKIPQFEQDYADQSESFAKQASEYYAVLENYDVDKLLTEMALVHGFSKEDLYSLNMSFPTNYLTMRPYLGTASEEQNLTGVYEASVTFQLQGSREKIQEFIDLLANEQDSIRISGLQWTKSDNGLYYLTVNLQIYMVEQPQ